MILVDIDEGVEVCQLSELFTINGEPAFCKTDLLSSWELGCSTDTCRVESFP